jgi:hypothetical protein
MIRIMTLFGVLEFGLKERPVTIRPRRDPETGYSGGTGDWGLCLPNQLSLKAELDAKTSRWWGHGTGNAERRQSHAPVSDWPSDCKLMADAGPMLLLCWPTIMARYRSALKMPAG